MIKFHARGPKGDLYGFGITAGNVERLKKGEPIVIDMGEVGVSGMHITLFYGETEEVIARELQQHGLIPASFDTSQPGPGEVRVFRDEAEGTG
jgi:hypothetical protein